MSRVRNLVFLLPLIALWLVPLIVFAAVFPAAERREEAAARPDPPGVVTVGARQQDFRQAAEVVLTSGDSPAVKVRSAGLLTGVLVSSGDPITAGTPVIAVDGHQVRAYPADAPLYRDLTRGDVGPDVEALGRYLVTLGHLRTDRVGPTFGAAMEAAVIAFQKESGLPSDGVFHISSVVYIPPTVTQVGEVEVAPGDRVQDDMVVFRGRRTPTSLSLRPSGGASFSASLGVAPLTLTVGSAQLGLSSLQASEDEFAALTDALDGAVARGEIAVASAEDPSTQVYTGLSVARAEPESYGVVPATAVVAADTGALCVFTVDGDGPEALTRAAALPLGSALPATGELGQVFVSPDLVGRDVVRDPAGLARAVLSTCA